MTRLGNRLFIGVGGHAVALDPASGEEIWRTKLKTSSVATVAIVGGALYGAANGELFRLDPATGAILWKNRLKGLGMGDRGVPRRQRRRRRSGQRTAAPRRGRGGDRVTPKAGLPGPTRLKAAARRGCR